MSEHDDDLEPEVDEGAEIEREGFPILDEDDIIDITDEFEQEDPDDEDESEI